MSHREQLRYLRVELLVEPSRRWREACLAARRTCSRSTRRCSRRPSGARRGCRDQGVLHAITVNPQPPSEGHRRSARRVSSRLRRGRDARVRPPSRFGVGFRPWMGDLKAGERSGEGARRAGRGGACLPEHKRPGVSNRYNLFGALGVLTSGLARSASAAKPSTSIPPVRLAKSP